MKSTALLTALISTAVNAATLKYDWLEPFNNGEDGSMNVTVGDVINFHWDSTAQTMEHNVWEMTDETAWDACDLQGTNVVLTDASGSNFQGQVGSIDVTFAETGNFYFVCQIPGHCLAHQKLKVSVYAAPIENDYNPADPTTSVDRLYSATCAPKKNEVACKRVAGCDWTSTGPGGSEGFCALIDCAAKANCEDCAYSACGWQQGKCQDVPGGSGQGEEPCLIADIGCWTKPDLANPITGFCEADTAVTAGTASGGVAVGSVAAAVVAAAGAAAVFA